MIIDSKDKFPLPRSCHSEVRTLEKYIKAISPAEKPQQAKYIDKNSTQDTNPLQLELKWINLSCVFETINLEFTSILPRKRRSINVVLKCLNGKVSSGMLLGVMGPSGCGKSTFLDCLRGQRKKGLSGEIHCSSIRPVKISFIAQEDHLLEHLTVRETLIFASKAKNIYWDVHNSINWGIDESKSKNQRLVDTSNTNLNDSLLDKMIDDYEKIIGINNIHNEILNGKDRLYVKRISAELQKTKRSFHLKMADHILGQLGLSEHKDLKVINCSGGQKKRLSIALELISRPDLLILDEPTSGLDSSSCLQCIQTLSRLTKKNQPLAIVASIHQPSARVLNLFSQLYILSKDGQCIYKGSPNEMVNHLASFNLICPKYYNPADFVIEIASGEHGTEGINRLITNHIITFQSGKYFTIDKRNYYHFWYHTYLLLKRCTLITARDPLLTSLRFVTYISVAIIVSLLYGPNIGQANGCKVIYYAESYEPPDLLQANENISFLFFTLLFMLFTALMPTVLTFPLEMSVFLKEHRNGWYNCSSYYLAKFLSDSPFQLIFPIIYCSISYFLTKQMASIWRFGIFVLISCLMSFLAQSVGLLIGASCVSSPAAAVFIAPITAIPVLLFSGFFVRTLVMPDYLRPISYCSYMRFAFEAIVTGIYGFERCTSNIRKPRSIEFDKYSSNSSWIEFDNSTDLERYQFKGQTVSYIMQQFSIDNDTVWKNTLILLGFIFFFRSTTYLIFLYKANCKH